MRHADNTTVGAERWYTVVRSHCGCDSANPWPDKNKHYFMSQLH